MKVVQKALHKKSITIRDDGRQIKISENILKETRILRYLSSNNPPLSLAKYVDFWYDKKRYYLVMEDAGNDFFDFIVKCHSLIEEKRISISEWHRFCRIAMKQMVDLVEWMHNTMQLRRYLLTSVVCSCDFCSGQSLSF